MKFSWIQEVLDSSFPSADWSVGVDLNGDGTVQQRERLDDSDKDGVVGSKGDWEKYFADNRIALEQKVAFFRSSAKASLRIDNPFHAVMAIESELATPEEVEAAYQRVGDLVWKVQTIVKGEGWRDQFSVESENPHATIVLLIYDLLKRSGISYKGNVYPLLTQSLKGNVLDCDSSSFVVQAVAHELGLPLFLVTASTHVFLRWGGEGNRFNVDEGKILSDQFYLDYFQLKKGEPPVSNGVYLRSLSLDESTGIVVDYCGIARKIQGDRAGAMADFTKAVKLNPRNAGAFFNRGLARDLDGDIVGAMADYTKTVELDPTYAMAFGNRGFVRSVQGDLAGAIADFTKAIELEPTSDKLFRNRGLARSIQGDRAGALADLREALRLNPDDDFVRKRIQELKQ